jgi:hypothetical protein
MSLCDESSFFLERAIGALFWPVILPSVALTSCACACNSYSIQVLPNQETFQESEVYVHVHHKELLTSAKNVS